MSGKTIKILVISSILCFTSSYSKEIGEKCRVLNRPGICTLDRNCQSFRSMSVKERQILFQARCGFQGASAILCCPSAPTSKTTMPPLTVQPKPKKQRKSKEACDNLAARTVGLRRRRHLLINERISFSDDVENGDFPQFAALGYQYDLKKATSYNCGGVLISKNFVLTAAQCLSDSLKIVTLGTIALKAGVNLRSYIRRVDVNVKVRT